MEEKLIEAFCEFLEEWLECSRFEALIELVGGLLFLGTMFLYTIIILAIFA